MVSTVSKKEYRKYGNMNPIGKLVLKKNVQEGNDKEEGIWKYGKTRKTLGLRLAGLIGRSDLLCLELANMMAS